MSTSRSGNSGGGNPPSEDPQFGKLIDLRERRRREAPEVVRIDQAEIGDPLKLCGVTVAGRFLLQMCIGKGGMACAYLAYDIHADRDCVVKVALHPHLTPRFEREAQCYWRLEGTPGVPRIYDQGALDDGRYYLALQLVQGETLSERLQNGARLSWADAVALGIKLNAIVSAIHRAGVLHRDIKPGNVMITPAGEIYLIDFGMAWFNGAKPLTPPDMPLGTKGFQSPEQRLGRIFELDQQTDIYSVAMVLRFAIGGPPAVPSAAEYDSSIPVTLRLPDGTPFADKSLQAVLMQRRLRAMLPFIPPALANVLQKASAPSANDRYETADEFSDALRSFLSSGNGVVSANPARSRRWKRIALIGLGSVLAGAAAIALLFLMRPDPSATKALPMHWIEEVRK